MRGILFGLIILCIIISNVNCNRIALILNRKIIRNINNNIVKTCYYSANNNMNDEKLYTCMINNDKDCNKYENYNKFVEISQKCIKEKNNECGYGILISILIWIFILTIF